jgi:hypothetical protein
MLGGLLVWSYGTNNLALPGVPIPLVDLLLVALVIHSRRWWRPFTQAGSGNLILALLVVLAAFSAVRLIVDYPKHGMLAVRGAVFALEVWAILLGVAVARRVGRPTVDRMITVLFALALAWFCLYPWRSQVVQLSPVVGVQREARLFSFTSAGFVSAWAIFWFGQRRSTNSTVATVAALFVVMLVQSRGVLAGSLVGLMLLLWVSRPVHRGVMIRRMLIGGTAVVLLLAVLPPLPGRLGVASVDTLIDLARTGIGLQGNVATSFDDRSNWNEATLSAISDQRLGWIVGVGFGQDLTRGFGVAGAQVINPHNDFLEFYARLGLGALPWFALWWVAASRMWRQARNNDHLARWGLAASGVTVMVSLTQPFSSFAYGGMTWWLLVGLVLASATSDASPHERRLERRAFR